MAGFTSCFTIRIPNPLKNHVVLIFLITQHSRDEQLIKSFINYFNCGSVYKRKNICEFVVTKFSDIKLFPFSINIIFKELNIKITLIEVKLLI
jgi:hypothetical protein